MKKWMRLFIPVLLAACMFALTSCGGREAGDGAGKAFVPSAIRYTAAPAAAFGDMDNARVIAVSADRQKLLVTSPFDLYIWDVGAGKRIPVSFSAEEDLDQLELNMNRSLMLGPNNKKLTEEQMEKRIEAGKDYLAKQNQTRFTNVDQIMECYPRMIQIRAVCYSMGEHFVLVSENTNLLGMFTLDMRTGEARMIPSDRASMVFPTLCGDRMLSGTGITDLNSGETVAPEMTEEKKPEEDLAPRPGLRLLPDDSILALSRGADFTETMESNFYLRKLFKDGTGWALLGSYPMGFSDSALFVTGDLKYAAVSPPFHLQQGPVIVNLETMEVQTLDARDLIVIGEYDSGFICYSLQSLNAVRLDAASLKQTQLRQTGDSWPEMNVTVIGALKSNGRNFCAQSAVIRGYFTADDK